MWNKNLSFNAESKQIECTEFKVKSSPFIRLHLERVILTMTSRRSFQVRSLDI